MKFDRLIISAVISIHFSNFALATSDPILGTNALQTARSAESSFREPCEAQFRKIKAEMCRFSWEVDSSGSLLLRLDSPNKLEIGGQFETDFPDALTVKIPFDMISEEGGKPNLSRFKRLSIDSSQSSLCSRSIRTELNYELPTRTLLWSYTTNSTCAHDNFQALLEIKIESDLEIHHLEYRGRKSTMANCPGGYSHGLEHRFSCTW